MLNLLKQLQYLAESGICFLASFLMEVLLCWTALYVKLAHNDLVHFVS